MSANWEELLIIYFFSWSYVKAERLHLTAEVLCREALYASSSLSPANKQI